MRLAPLLLVACAHAPPPLAVDPQPVVAFADPARAAKLATAFPALDRLVDGEREAQRIPGLAFVVVVDGALVYARGAGVLDLAHPTPVDADTVFRIGSMTKTITGLAILQLRDRGVLALDDPMTRWLPALAQISPKPTCWRTSTGSRSRRPPARPTRTRTSARACSAS